MQNAQSVLIITTLSIAFFHTITGPDHYLPFVVISKARGWNYRKTFWFTVLCGIGHVGSSIVLGILGITFGIAINKIELWESQRGSLISIILMIFGLLYFLYGVYRAYVNRPHSHLHIHSHDEEHTHEHLHDNKHHHKHKGNEVINITPWILFTIFVLGPCEPLIPILMYPAAENNIGLTILVTVIFSVVTISTMVLMVSLAYKGFSFVPLKKLERYGHAIAGATILLCGISMVFLGL